jgi:hypothetical protein
VGVTALNPSAVFQLKFSGGLTVQCFVCPTFGKRKHVISQFAYFIGLSQALQVLFDSSILSCHLLQSQTELITGGWRNAWVSASNELPFLSK